MPPQRLYDRLLFIFVAVDLLAVKLASCREIFNTSLTPRYPCHQLTLLISLPQNRHLSKLVMDDLQESLDLANDIDQSFCEKFPLDGDLRQVMVDIAKHSGRRYKAQDWARNLRFLLILQSKDIEGLYNELPKGITPTAATPCQTVLKVGDQLSLTDPAAYIAVSYCWERSNLEWFTDHIEKPIEILEAGIGKRPSVVPPDVLHRSIAYAKHQDINAIWIDQECINQDDDIEKEYGIQSMDIVYQQSRHPIAILQYCFGTQIELNVFSSLFGRLDEVYTPDQIEVLYTVLSDISEDPWFSRAWTLQEATSAGASMMLLIGCPGLEKCSSFGPIPGEFEISTREFQDCMAMAVVFIEERLEAGTWADNSLAISASNCASEMWNVIPTIHSDSAERNDSHRQQCTAAEALTLLENRISSVFSDRLAIMANICNYEVRIDSKVLKQPDSSFSACALTLAVLNGDMSLLAGCLEKAPRYKHGRADCRSSRPLFYWNDNSDSSANAYGFSWGPRPSASLSNIIYLEEINRMFRLMPATLSTSGLKVCGILWEMKPLIRAPKTQRQFITKWRQELDLWVVEILEDTSGFHKHQSLLPLSKEFCWSLLHELMDSGHTDLVKTLWNYFQPWPRYNSPTLPRISFETCFGPFSNAESELTKARRSCNEENDIINRLTPGILFDWTSDSNTGILIPQTYEKKLRYTVLSHMINQVCATGALLCGIPLKFPRIQDQVEPKPSARVWFESCDENDLVFTPFTQLRDEVMSSEYRKEAMSWRVVRTGKVAEQCEVLHCLGRRRGVYLFEGLMPQDYILD